MVRIIPLVSLQPPSERSDGGFLFVSNICDWVNSHIDNVTNVVQIVQTVHIDTPKITPEVLY